MYDLIIVGARCAGSATALLLARKGYRVLVVDKATFPSDTLSTHFVHLQGIVRLKRWGLLDQVIASNCPPVSQWTFDFGPFQLTGAPQPIEGVGDVYCPRRLVLDKLLIDAAAEAGAEIREGFVVEEILMEGSRVTGIRGHAHGGGTVTEYARLVIGADGMRSMVAQVVQAEEYNVRPKLNCAYFTYWSGIALDGVEDYPRDQKASILFPTNDGLVCTFLEFPLSQFHSFRADIEGNFLKMLDEISPQLGERVRAGKREERFSGTADLPNFFRRSYGPGWALVGDAAYHRDPLTAQGIGDALVGADLLTEAIDAGFSGRVPLDVALADYEQSRDSAFMPMYDLNYQLATLAPPPPHMQQLFFALRNNPQQLSRFYGALSGSVPLPEFFAPSNVETILTAAQLA